MGRTQEGEEENEQWGCVCDGSIRIYSFMACEAASSKKLHSQSLRAGPKYISLFISSIWDSFFHFYCKLLILGSHPFSGFLVFALYNRFLFMGSHLCALFTISFFGRSVFVFSSSFLSFEFN